MIFDSNSIQEYLFSELDRRLQNNPRYSQRAFARDLKLSPGALSEILHEKRPITAKLVFKLEKSLGLSSIEVSHLLSLLGSHGESSSGDVQLQNKREVSLQLFRLISEWYHFAILNLMDVKNFEWSADWIAKKLGISFIQARSAMKRLCDMDAVVKKGSKYVPGQEFIFSPEDIPSSAIRKYHKEMLENCITALETQNVEQRSILGSGIALRKADLPKIKKEISEFHTKLLHKYSKKSADYVYHYESALIRVTKEDDDV